MCSVFFSTAILHEKRPRIYWSFVAVAFSLGFLENKSLSCSLVAWLLTQPPRCRSIAHVAVIASIIMLTNTRSTTTTTSVTIRQGAQQKEASLRREEAQQTSVTTTTTKSTTNKRDAARYLDGWLLKWWWPSPLVLIEAILICSPVVQNCIK